MRCRQTFGVVFCVFLVVVVAGTLAAAQEADGGVRLLLIDETKTFASTMRVGALAGALKGSGMFQVSVRLVDVESSYEDPLVGALPDEAPFDIILILPRGLDDRSVSQIWLVSGGLDELAPPVRAGLAGVSQVLDQIFQGLAEAIDVSEDLWPGLLAALYQKKGLLR